MVPKSFIRLINNNKNILNNKMTQFLIWNETDVSPGQPL